jgi:hypothetical protein
MKKSRADIICKQVNIPSPCPMEWKNLTVGRNRKQRLCTSCDETVYLCLTEAESIENTRLGRCIAIPKTGFLPEVPKWMNMTIGRGYREE